MSDAHGIRHTPSEGSATVPAAIERVLACHPSIVVAILFGSLAAGHSRNDSDLDLAVTSTTPLDPQIRIQLIEELAVLLGRPIDLIDLAQTHGPLLQQILTKGRLLICTDRTRYADLLLRVVYEEADVMPYYRRILAERRQAWIGS
jgi:predicted nucleotidyltransferase